MKRIIITLFLFVLLLATSVLAKEIDLIPSSSSIIVYTGETETIDISLLNNQMVRDRFSISIWPPFWAGIIATPEKYTTYVDANSNVTLKIYFSAALDAEELLMYFNISVRSLTNEQIRDSKIITLRTIRKFPLYLSDIKLDKYLVNPEESVKIEVQITNIDADDYEGASLQTVIKKEGEVIERFDHDLSPIPGKSSVTVEDEFQIPKYTSPALYSVETVLKDRLKTTVSTKTTNFRVKQVKNVVHQKSVSYGIFFQTTTITVKNEGNVEVTEFLITESIPAFLKNFFYPTGQYTEEKLYDTILYHWLIRSLSPGEERIIKYEINLWSLWIIGLVLVGCVFFAFRYVFAPKIVKKYRLVGPIKRGKEIIISLEVKNRTRHEIKDVVVRDFVPPIVKLVEKFTTLKPQINVTDAGTELLWKITSLRPKEERVLIYTIKPVVDVIGTLRLPKARITFLDRKAMKKVYVSKSILIKAR